MVRGRCRREVAGVRGAPGVGRGAQAPQEAGSPRGGRGSGGVNQCVLQTQTAGPGRRLGSRRPWLLQADPRTRGCAGSSPCPPPRARASPDHAPGSAPGPCTLRLPAPREGLCRSPPSASGGSWSSGGPHPVLGLQSRSFPEPHRHFVTLSSVSHACSTLRPWVPGVFHLPGFLRRDYAARSSRGCLGGGIETLGARVPTPRRH